MKKLIMSITILLFSLCLLTYNFYNEFSIDDTSINNIKPQNMLSIMLESSDGSGNYVMTTQNSWPTDGYVFNSELSKCENGGTLSWDKTNKRVEFSGNNIDKCYVYFDKSTTLTSFVISQYTGTQGENNIYYHDVNLTNGAGDNSYRYAGANPNNYVCFGSDEVTCPHENLYRIIGVIDGKIKLISADGATTDMLGTNEGYAKTYQAAHGSASGYKGNGDLTKIGTYKWNKTSKNTWSTSTTNTINLNNNFLTYLDSKNAKWKTMIADTTWYVGGMTSANGCYSNAKTAYNYEVGANKDASTSVTSKIGLMYVSEYYYGATTDYWTLPGYNSSGHDDYRTAINDNWLYTGLFEWTLSRYSEFSFSAFSVYDDGHVESVSVDDSLGYAVRPSFSLSSSIKFTSGEGTAVNPIRIKS